MNEICHRQPFPTAVFLKTLCNTRLERFTLFGIHVIEIREFFFRLISIIAE